MVYHTVASIAKTFYTFQVLLYMANKIEINQSVKLTQKQGLILSDKLEMSLKVMQLSVLDLRALVLQELENNVALELVKDEYEKLDSEIHKKHYLNGNSDFIESISSENKSIQSSLLSQLHFVKAKRGIIKLASLIIQNLDDRGFNIVSIDELVASQMKNAKKEEIRIALNIVRNFDPKACAFDSVNKTLLFQLYLLYQSLIKPLQKKTIRLFRLTIHVLHLAFPFEERGGEKYIREKLKKANISIKPSEATEVINLIKTLNPYPGYLCERTDKNNGYITPDVYVEYEKGEIKISTNREVLPRVKVSNDIEALAKDNKFASDSVKKARELISAIKNRKSTLLKIVELITIFQRDFFCYGISYLSPLRQKDIAEELNMSPSTVSRIASNKYLYCNWGLFKIGYFFTQKATSNNDTDILSPNASYVGSGYSKQACKEIIKDIITEKPDMPDREIGEALSKKGITISRRTIAKYRKELGIKGVHER